MSAGALSIAVLTTKGPNSPLTSAKITTTARNDIASSCILSRMAAATTSPTAAAATETAVLIRNRITAKSYTPRSSDASSIEWSEWR